MTEIADGQLVAAFSLIAVRVSSKSQKVGILLRRCTVDEHVSNNAAIMLNLFSTEKYIILMSRFRQWKTLPLL